MKPELPQVPVEWLEFTEPKSGERWQVHLNFVMSSWECMFGQGCAGNFGIQDSTINPDLGCCHQGTHILDKDEELKVADMVTQLTEEDLSQEGLDYIAKNGWLNKTRKKDVEDYQEQGKTRIRRGGCVFANRSDESNGKSGCAFHHLGERIGKTHIETMPMICWSVPMQLTTVHDQDGEEVARLFPASRDDWGGGDNMDSWLSWWCVENPDAYIKGRPGGRKVYESLELEMREMMGQDAYDVMRVELEKRKDNYIEPMAGQVRNEGRPMLPLLVGNRTPRQGGEYKL